jgi:DNA-binding MarR family transcriptional regulator
MGPRPADPVDGLFADAFQRHGCEIRRVLGGTAAAVPPPPRSALSGSAPASRDEYPGADRTCTEAYASLCRTGEALLGELDRRVRLTFGIPQTAATALAVIEGAGVPLTPSQVSDRVLIASATMTATLDLLEHRGWIRRTANPGDRRSTLIEITPDGRAAADQLLPGIRALEKSILSALTDGERAHLLDLLAKILARAAEVAAGQPEPLNGQRIRPARSAK